MQIISNIALISINETLIFQMISFLIFLYIFNRVMIRPIRGVMSEREDHIDKVKQDIEEAQQEVQLLNKRVHSGEATVRRTALEMRAQLEESGNQEAGVIFDEARQEIDALRIEAKTEVEAQVAEARKSVRSEAETLALTIMEKVLSRGVAS